MSAPPQQFICTTPWWIKLGDKYPIIGQVKMETSPGPEESCKTTIRKVLSKVTKDYWVAHQVEVLECPSALDFMRKAIIPYRPVILRGLMDDWNAMEQWDMEHLCEVMGDSTVPVNLTPDGFADAVKSVRINEEESRIFTYPCELNMPFSKFYDIMMAPDGINDAVPYLSEQNDNLRQKFSSLANDIPSQLPIAAEAFPEAETEAINLWIGDERSITSLHKDHFEVTVW